MSVIMLSEQGARLTKRGRSLVLFKNRKKKFIYPLSNVDRIMILGRIEFSAALIGLLLREEIDVVFLTIDGRYKGRLCGKSAKNVFVRQAQYDRLKDENFRLEFTKAIVSGKSLNQMRFVLQHRQLDPEEIKERWRNFQSSVAKADNLYILRGLEGSFSALYFDYFRQMLKCRMGFEKRIKHPPPDPINILLSLGYTLLFNNIYALIEGYGFDPYVGFFHDLSYGHPALVSDLMEEFRAPLIDRLVLNVVNRQQIKESNFEKDDKGYRLNKDGLNTFVTAYRELILQRQNFGGEKINYVQIMQRQVQQFRQFLQGERDHYESFRSK